MKGKRNIMRAVSFITAFFMCISFLAWDGLTVKAETGNVDTVVRLNPDEASPFNDTNGDGLGEFEGWGTSLCWWANRVGYSEALTEKAKQLFFSDDGLDMNIGRYNIGGGDHTGGVQRTAATPNPNAAFYVMTDADYAGENMELIEVDDMVNVPFLYSDADFGITKGDDVGSLKYLGWISKLGEVSVEGSNLHFDVNVNTAGAYTVKMLLTLAGYNDRGMGIRVTPDNSMSEGYKDYFVSEETVNSNVIASGNDRSLFVVTFSDVQLQAGKNTIDVGGDEDWALDFLAMAVIEAGKEGVLSTPAENEFLHDDHITRSDSGVPGYAIDVTKMDLVNKTLAEYQGDYAAVDQESGYAWNYNWEADKNQINILKAAVSVNGSEFHAEAFSNSPPYFMTNSGCSSGNVDANIDNLRPDCYTAFATYMADVIKHWNDEGIITFKSASPMNEPHTDYWGAYSWKQEGCHFERGDSQSRIIVELNKALKDRGIDLIISGTDETGIDEQIASYNALSTEAKSIVQRIDTHTYQGSDRHGLKMLAEGEGKNLWMSEVDGSYTAGSDAGEMSAALGLAQQIIRDINGMECSAWILWNAIDMHIDSSDAGKVWVEEKSSPNDFLTEEAMYNSWWWDGASSGYWGFAAADHDKEDILLTMKYYGYGQFSKYIRPGYILM